MDRIQKKKLSFNGTTLKSIALLSMLADHIAVLFVAQQQHPWLYLLLRLVGRFSFLIFAFMLVVGFAHTKNLHKYLFRILLFAIITEIPYDLAFNGTIIEFGRQNVLFTFCIGLMMLAAIRHFGDSTGAFIGFGFLACAAAVLLRCDYSYFGILVIIFYYFDQFDKTGRIFSLALLNWLKGDFVQGVGGCLTLIFTENYDGSKPKIPGWFCYVFYPAHLLVLWAIHLIL